MKTPHVVFFYSHREEKQFRESLGQDISIAAFPFDHVLKTENLNLKPSFVIICDTSKEERGISRLEAIKKAFPHLPLFLIVEDPSKEYLMAALKFKVSSFFTLPAKNDELRQAVLQAIKATKKFNLVEIIKGWFSRLQYKPKAIKGYSSQPALGVEKPKGLDVWKEGPSPYLHFPKKELEPEKSYDMSVQFFGNLNIHVREKPAPIIKGKKNTAVMAYLLFHHHRLTHRDILMDKFWRNFTTSSAKNSLNVSICSLRKNLSIIFKDQDIIVYDSESYGINPELKIITDTEKFIYHWKKGSTIESSKGLPYALEAYSTAINYYKAEFLSNIRFDNWCEYERDNLKEIYLFILNRLSIHFFDQKQYNACINIGKKMLAEDNCLEEVHRKLMSCYYVLGQADLALKQYFRCKKALSGELNLTPSEPTIEMFKRIQSGYPIIR